MSLVLNTKVIEATKSDALEPYRKSASMFAGRMDYAVVVQKIDDEGLRDIQAAARSLKDGKTARAVEAILLARAGEFSKSIPNFQAFEGMLNLFLRRHLIDGWIYVTGKDGKIYPELVTEITYDDGRSGRNGEGPKVIINTICYGYNGGRGNVSVGMFKSSHWFTPQDVTRKRIGDVLGEKGIYCETADLKAEYEASLDRFLNEIKDGFANQFIVDGTVYTFEGYAHSRRSHEVGRRKVIHDMAADDYGALGNFHECSLLDTEEETGAVGQVPIHPLIRVYDLQGQEFFWVHSDFMTPYVYDDSLRDKLVLPRSHRDLLDVLTQDIGAFTGDIIEGKSAGNTILCKGVPGIGKTLTAEVYAELIHRPLYMIHSGNLGTKADEIDKNLRMVFQRAKRWGCVLLLDEADVFVMTRGASIEQNAIVADFLRTLEYFDGLLFMTTNRADDIDDAIISRCLAIIHYTIPKSEDAARVWRVMAANNNVELGEDLIRDLLDLFPTITPRDIKLLLRLTLRVVSSRGEPLSIDTFRRCAMFRAIEMSP